MTRTLTILLFACLLSGCGWQLRGQGEFENLAAYPEALYLATGSQHPVAAELRRQLTLRGVELLAQPRPGVLSLQLDRLQSGSYVESLDAGLQARQVGLSRGIGYRFSDSTGASLAEGTLEARRSLIQNPRQPASADREQARLEAEMVAELAGNLIDLIRYQAATHENQG